MDKTLHLNRTELRIMRILQCHKGYLTFDELFRKFCKMQEPQPSRRTVKTMVIRSLASLVEFHIIRANYAYDPETETNVPTAWAWNGHKEFMWYVDIFIFGDAITSDHGIVRNV